MPEFKTDLGEYILWYDGIVEINPSKLEDLFLKGVDPTKIAVTEMSRDVQQYNKLARHKITTKDEVDADLINFDWNIPQEYLDLNVHEYVWTEFSNKCSKVSSTAENVRRERIDRELAEYTKRDLLNVLKVLIYMVDMFKQHNVVWGVGRGSSCASYILYLLEVHSVDPIKYEIPLEEFFK